MTPARTPEELDALVRLQSVAAKRLAGVDADERRYAQQRLPFNRAMQLAFALVSPVRLDDLLTALATITDLRARIAELEKNTL